MKPHHAIARSIATCSLAALAVPIGAGCAGLEQARLDALDRAVTVSTPRPLYDFRRVAMEAPTCQGAQCAGVSGVELERQVEQAASGACYEVVSSEEVARYAKHYGGGQSFGFDFGMGQTVDVLTGLVGGGKGGGSAGMGWTTGMRVSFDQASPDARDVVIDELGLTGIVKTSLSFGQPDQTTGFVPVTLDVRLMDAIGRTGVWQARLEGDLMNEGSPQEAVTRLGYDLKDALRRRAEACTPPPAPPQQQVFTGFQVVEQKIDLPDRIHFELASTKLSPRSHGMLGQVAHFLGTRPDITLVRIEGHTDSDGADADNQALSEGRAAAVRDFLVSQGVAASRLEAKGFGETKPVVANDSIANKATNRRVDLIIVK
ncbi:MAG: OmpA family protein [Deltaproteobacteria bacterium]|nr:OmpA family protein [Deltaproteobacteria bacterium]